jgi:hypothetical protein
MTSRHNESPSVVIAFDAVSLNPFFGRKAQTLADLSKHMSKSPDMYLFDAASPHNILSFAHSVNYGGKGGNEGLLIQISFIDPTYDFELKFTKGGDMFDFVKQKITNPDDAKVQFPVAFQNTYIGLYNTAIEEEWKAGAQKNLTAKGVGATVHLDAKKEEALHRQAAQIVMDKYNATVDNKSLGRQLSIAYGIGNDLSKWAGPFICVPSLITNKYDGAGTRILNIEMVPTNGILAAENNESMIDDGFDKYGEGVSVISLEDFERMGTFKPRLIPKTITTFQPIQTGPMANISGGVYTNPHWDKGFSGFHRILTSMIRNFANNFVGDVPAGNIVTMFPNFDEVFMRQAELILNANKGLFVARFGKDWETSEEATEGVPVHYPDIFNPDGDIPLQEFLSRKIDTYVTLKTDLGRKVLQDILALINCSLLYVDVTSRAVANSAASIPKKSSLTPMQIVEVGIGAPQKDVVISTSNKGRNAGVDTAWDWGLYGEPSWDNEFTGIVLEPYVTPLQYEENPNKEGPPPHIDQEKLVEAQIQENYAASLDDPPGGDFSRREIFNFRQQERIDAVASMYGGSSGEKVWIGYRKGNTTETYQQSLDNFLLDIKNVAGENMPGVITQRWVTETDMLEIMAEKGVIVDSTKPALVIGVEDLINDFVFAQLKLKEIAYGATNLQAEIKAQLNDTDINLYSDDYLTEMDKIMRPTNTKMGPFEELFVPDIVLDHTSDTLLGADQPKNIQQFGITASTNKQLRKQLRDMGIPIFRSGVMKSNILSLDLELDPLYFANLMQNFDYDDTTLGAGMATTTTSPNSLGVNAGNNGALIQAAQYFANKTMTLMNMTGPQSATNMVALMSNMTRGINKRGPINFLNPLSTVTPVAVIQDLARRLMGMFMQGGIKTLPLFRLSGWSVLARPCYVIVKEQRIHPSKTGLGGAKDKVTAAFKPTVSQLYTGLWTIYGFRHVITSQDAYSQFTIIKTPLTPPKSVAVTKSPISDVGDLPIIVGAQELGAQGHGEQWGMSSSQPTVKERRFEEWTKRYGDSLESGAIFTAYEDGLELTPAQITTLLELMSTQ